MRTITLTLAYDGSAYQGWQRQDHGASVQALVEAALARLEGAPVTVIGAGRTDAGVHALGQVARARLTVSQDTATIQRALNAILPPDVRVLRVDEAADGFHPRFDARSKTYQYWMWDAGVLPPSVRAWCWHVPRRLDVAAMDRSARALVGRHDFAAFQSTGGGAKTSTRTVLRAGVSAIACGLDAGDPVRARLAPAEGRFVVVEIEADGFLRHMVRAIVGTLVEIGDGRRAEAAMTALLAGKDRGATGATAPAHGLVLVRVAYESEHAADAAPGPPR
jgi:tRNA pseudouridine38-40 synthase